MSVNVHAEEMTDRAAAEWRTAEDGYHRRRQLVDDCGRIIGYVAGCPYGDLHGWAAAVDTGGLTAQLGKFTTQLQAETAVERYWKSNDVEAQQAKEKA